MDFSRYQLEAARTTRRLRFAYILAVLGVVLVFNAAALLAWRLLFAGAPLPYGFLLVNRRTWWHRSSKTKARRRTSSSP